MKRLEEKLPVDPTVTMAVSVYRCGVVQNAEVLPMIHSLRKQARRLLIITLTGGFISSTMYASFAMSFGAGTN